MMTEGYRLLEREWREATSSLYLKGINELANAILSNFTAKDTFGEIINKKKLQWPKIACSDLKSETI